MLVITADESDGPQSDATACCGEGARPELPAARHRRPRRRRDRRPGDLAVDAAGGTWSTTPYNHYSLLASLEEIFAAAPPRLRRDGRPATGSASTSTTNYDRTP